MQITVEEFETYICNVRMHTPGVYNCCNVLIFDNSFHFDNGYDVFVKISILDGDLVAYEDEFRSFFDDKFNAYAFAISFANRAVL